MVSVIADILQIITFVFSVCLLIGASISTKLKAWLKSIWDEWFYEHFEDGEKPT